MRARVLWAVLAGGACTVSGTIGAARLTQEQEHTAPATPAPPEATPCVAGVARLGFMTGDWSHKDDSGLWEERWSPPHSGCMVGSLRWVSEGQPRMYEMLALEENAQGHVRMFVRHFDKGLKPWAKEAGADAPTPTWVLTKVEKGLAVFEDHSIGFPAKMTYEAVGGIVAPTGLRVTLEGEANGAARVIVFEFGRLASEQTPFEDDQ